MDYTEDANSLYCDECGNPMVVEASGVTHHWDADAADVDYDADGDHVAYTMELS